MGEKVCGQVCPVALTWEQESFFCRSCVDQAWAHAAIITHISHLYDTSQQSARVVLKLTRMHVVYDNSQTNPTLFDHAQHIYAAAAVGAGQYGLGLSGLGCSPKPYIERTPHASCNLILQLVEFCYAAGTAGVLCRPAPA